MAKEIVSVERRAEIGRLVNLLADEIVSLEGESRDKFYFLLDEVHPYLRSREWILRVVRCDDEDQRDVELDRCESELLARVTPALRKAIVDLFTEASLTLASAESSPEN